METPNTNWMDIAYDDDLEPVKTRFVKSIQLESFNNSDTYLTVWRSNENGGKDCYSYTRNDETSKRRIGQFVALWLGMKVESEFCDCGHSIAIHTQVGCMHKKNDGLFCPCRRPDSVMKIVSENKRLRAELAALKRPPAIMDQDERAELEQRLYEAQMLEGSEMEY